MNTFILNLFSALFVVLSLASHAEQPVVVSFVKELKADLDFQDATNYTSIADTKAESPLKDADNYIGHLSALPTDTSVRSFTWQPNNTPRTLCTLVLSGDPKVRALTYDLDHSRFLLALNEDNSIKDVDLSKVHVSCPKDFSSVPAFNVHPKIDLGPTDFEQPLVLHFLIDDTSISDYLWIPTLGNPSRDEKRIEGETHAPEEWNDPTTGKTVKLIGNMAFTKATTESRKFSWRLKNDGLPSQQCYADVKYDPHVGDAYVGLNTYSMGAYASKIGDTSAIVVHCDVELAAEYRPLGAPIPRSL